MAEAGVDAHGYRMTTSTYRTECAWCGKNLLPGTKVWWHPRLKHVVCSPSHRVQGDNRIVSSRPRTTADTGFIPANQRDRRSNAEITATRKARNRERDAAKLLAKQEARRQRRAEQRGTV